MREYSESFIAYVHAVFRLWALVVGGATVALIAALAAAAGVELPRLVWILLLVVGLLLAQFLAFHSERMKATARPPSPQITVYGNPTININGGGGADESVVEVAESLAVAPPPRSQHDGGRAD